MNGKAGVERVAAALAAQGYQAEIKEFPAGTRSAADAAAAIGCAMAEIAKSLIFRTQRSESPVLVIASGGNRVDEAKLAVALGEEIERADATFVRRVTGFAIGGVPPLGHDQDIETLLDRDLAQFTEIWAAAGSPNAVFRLTPQALVALTGGRWADLREEID